jgi:hypothetical protein
MFERNNEHAAFVINLGRVMNNFFVVVFFRQTCQRVRPIGLMPLIGQVNSENRVWEQITTTLYLYRLKPEHCFRVEQRWVNSLITTVYVTGSLFLFRLTKSKSNRILIFFDVW